MLNIVFFSGLKKLSRKEMALAQSEAYNLVSLSKASGSYKNHHSKTGVRVLQGSGQVVCYIIIASIYLLKWQILEES